MNIPKEHYELIKEMYKKSSDNKSQVARDYCTKYSIPFSDKIRRKVSHIIDGRYDNKPTRAVSTKPKKKKVEKPENVCSSQGSESEDLEFMPSAWSPELKRFYTIKEFCEKYGLNHDEVKTSKLVAHNKGHMIYNIEFFTKEEKSVLNVEKHLEEVIKKYVKPVQIELNPLNPSEFRWVDRLVYTDVHLAMDVNGEGDPLYDGKWDKEEVLRRLKVMVEHVLTFKAGNVLYIDDLGDFLDGLGGQTTRKGHALPQNMNDKEAFDLALEFKMTVVDSLVDHYDYIVCNNVTEDNHAGVFGYFAAKAFKDTVDIKYKGKVIVNNFVRFIEHYKVGKHTFVDTHGKDSTSMKFGFKPQLDTKQIEKLDQYCKEHNLYDGNFIEISKGDSHQAILDETTSNDFDYYNYPSFSPPSNWVKTNFKNTKSGFRFFNIDTESQIKIHIPYYFDYEAKGK
jgi:hypothetical protein